MMRLVFKSDLLRCEMALCWLLSVTLAGSAAYGQTSDSGEAKADPPVTFSKVMSPETFTFNEHVSWGVKSLLRPDLALGKAVIMNGYESTVACETISLDFEAFTPAALAVRTGEGEASPFPFSVTFYKTALEACNVLENPELAANLSMSATSKTIEHFEFTINEIYETGAIDDYDSLVIMAGRLPAFHIRRKNRLEIWAFCEDVSQCLGHSKDTVFVSE